MPVVPYLPSIAFLADERARLDGAHATSRAGSPSSSTGSTAPHGVSHTIERIRELGVPGFEVEVIGTDRGVDRRLPAVAEVEMPFYEGLRLGVPSLPEPRRDADRGPLRPDPRRHARPGRGRRGADRADRGRCPLLASHHTEFVAYARMRTRQRERSPGRWPRR